jgi:hypothetical protein
VWEAGRFSTAAATIGNVCTVKLINLNAVNTLTLCIGLQGIIAHLKPGLKPGLWAFTPCKPSPSPIEARNWAGLGWAPVGRAWVGFGLWARPSTSLVVTVGSAFILSETNPMDDQDVKSSD